MPRRRRTFRSSLCQYQAGTCRSEIILKMGVPVAVFDVGQQIKLTQMNILNRILVPFFLLIIVAGNLFAQTDLQKIKERVTKEVMKSGPNDQQVALLLETIRTDGTWPGINYEDVSNTGFEHRNHLSNMIGLAMAYKSKSSAYFKKKKVKQAIELALKHWVDHDYICENWWYNQIGTPNGLVTLMLIAGDDLEASLVEKAQPMIGRAHIDAPGARPGGDRIKIAGIQAKNLLFLDEGEKFNTVIRVIESEIKFSDWVGATYGYGFRYIPTGFSNRQMGGRGIMHDYSFHHRVDGVNNTLSYGLGYAAAFVEWAVYTSGTDYAFSEERLSGLVDYFLDGICKTAVFGKYPDAGAKNRSISRIGALKPYNAEMAEKLLQTTGYRQSEVQEIADIRNKGIQPTVSHATFYWHTEHFTFQRPDWFASVRMYSTRTHNMEQPYNSEGLLNHHRGDGVNHISRTGDEYLDIWPVYDYQKIPGTTVLQKDELPSHREIQKLGITEFVGAATDGKYGTVGFDFRSPHDPLIARKAWFFFDDEYVCLGAGISCKNDDFPVATTLNQSLLKGEVMLAAQGDISPAKKGETTYDKVNWVLHDQIGYVFPGPTSVQLKNDTSSGSWWRINRQSDSPKDEISLDVFKLWFDHGTRPSEATYEYMVVPAADTEKMKSYEGNNPVTVIANTPENQVVMHTQLNMIQAVFYQAGEISLPGGNRLGMESPGIIILQNLPDGKMKITVTDPNRQLGKMYVSISQNVKRSGENFVAFWNEKKQQSEIIIDLPQGQYVGSSVSIEL